MRHFLAIVLTTLLSTAAFAEGFGFYGGLHFADVEANSLTSNAGVSTSSETGLRAGAVGEFPLGAFIFRSGALITQRNFSATDGSTTAEYEIMYLDIPATFVFPASESMKFYGGVELGLKLLDDCKDSSATSCSIDGAESMIFGATLGGQFQFTPNWGADVSYLIGLSDVVSGANGGGYENASGVSIGVLFFY